jgi:hypothetical protein
VVLAAYALLSLGTGCSHDGSPTKPPATQPDTTASGIVEAMSANYVILSADTVLIAVPPTNICDSLGQPVTVPGDTCRAYYSVSGSQFRIAIKDASAVVRVMTSGPSFSPAIGEFLTMIDTMSILQTMNINILGVFGRMSGDVGLTGQWRFTGMEPTILTLFLDSSQSAAI